MRIISMLLVLCMLLGFAACNTTPVDPVDSTTPPASDSVRDSTTPEETTTADTAVIQTGAQYYDAKDYLPTEKFDGEDIHIWIDGGELLYSIPDSRFIEGDIVQEAVLARNFAVEDTYNVVLNWDRDFTVAWRDSAALRQSILAGDEYDILGGPALYMNPHIVYGCFVDMAQSENIDLTQPWWLEEATANQRVYDRQFTAVGYFDFPTITRINAFYFNGLMTSDYKMGNLYDVVESGEWTWEKMLEYCETVAEDVNQDGIYDVNDTFGLTSRWDAWICEPATVGYQYITRGEDGEYTIPGATDDLIEMNEKIYPFITSSPMYFSQYTYGVHKSFPSELVSAGVKLFLNNQCLFYLGNLSMASTESFRDFGAYGILPPPKYLEGQEKYGSASSAFVSAISMTTGDEKISAIILEALQLESYNILRPEYIVNALSYKYLSDPQATDMLNLIFASVSTDWSYNFAGAGLGTDLCFTLPTQQYPTSYLHKNSSRIRQKLNDFLDAVEELP